MALNIQLIILKKIVDSLIEYIRADYNNNVISGTPQESFLARALDDPRYVDADYNLFEQAKAIFLRGQTSSRNVKTGLMFPKDVKPTPHIHVREPSKVNGDFNSIGGGLGSGSSFNTDGRLIEEYRDTKRASYEIVVTSDNPLDTILIAEVMYSLLLSAHDTMNSLFATHNYSMRELIMNNNVRTPHLYVRAISIDVRIENNIPALADKTLLGKVVFNGIMKTDGTT